MPAVAEARFRAMGSDCHVVVVGGDDGLLAAARRTVDRLEAAWSRFQPTSEVSRLNAAAGERLAVGPDTTLLLRTAQDAWRLTGGLVDAGLLAAVVAAGYDRSFDDLPAEGPAGPAPALAAALGPSILDVEVGDGWARVPAGGGVDPGGVGKGLAADLVAEELVALGAAGACANLGGDLRALGEGPGGAAWTVAVEHPWAAEPLAVLGLAEGAAATSTTLRRRWRRGGEERHHLIDPGTGRPAATHLALATVLAAEAWQAEALAKATLVRGGPAPFDLVDGTGAQALVVDLEGGVAATPGLAAHLGGARLPRRVPPPAG